MEELDKTFRQRINSLDTPPPQSRWHPDRAWDRLEGLLQEPVPPVKRTWRQYYAAAVLALLLIPAGWLLLKRAEEPRKREVYTQNTSPEVRQPESAAMPDQRLQPAGESVRETRHAGKVAPGKRRILQQKAEQSLSPPQPSEIIFPEHADNQENTAVIAVDTAAVHPGISTKAVSPVGEEVKTFLSQQAVPERKNGPVTITLTFPGRGDSAEATVSRETTRPRRSTFRKVIIGRSGDEPMESVSGATNIFSIITEKKQ